MCSQHCKLLRDEIIYKFCYFIKKKIKFIYLSNIFLCKYWLFLNKKKQTLSPILHQPIVVASMDNCTERVKIGGRVLGNCAPKKLKSGLCLLCFCFFPLKNQKIKTGSIMVKVQKVTFLYLFA